MSSGRSFNGLLCVIKHGDFSARSNEESRLDGASVALGNTQTRVGTDQTLLAHRDDHVAAAGQGPHG